MRRFKILTGLGLLALAAGCIWGCKRDVVPDPPATVTTQTPSAANLVAYLNKNARLVQSVKSTKVEMDAKQDGQSIGLEGMLFCQKPRNFRLRANDPLGKPAVDIGSNDNEFWFWISAAKDEDGVPRVHYCSYSDMAAGKARMPFPFQPDMIVSALGLGEYDPKGNYTVKDDPKTISLIEQTTSAQGQPVQKATVFSRTRVAPGKPQVLAYLLLDEKGKEICRASVQDVQAVSVERRAGRAAAAGAAGLGRAENRAADEAVRHAGQQHQRAAGGEALQPRRPGQLPGVEPGPGVGRAQGLLAGHEASAHAADGAGEVRRDSASRGAQPRDSASCHRSQKESGG